MLTGICDSCGDAGDALVGVHRIYLRPSPSLPDGPVDLSGPPDVLPDIEQWCFPCRTHYPHQLIAVDD
jgi:hypothetical protein